MYGLVESRASNGKGLVCLLVHRLDNEDFEDCGRTGDDEVSSHPIESSMRTTDGGSEEEFGRDEESRSSDGESDPFSEVGAPDATEVKLLCICDILLCGSSLAFCTFKAHFHLSYAAR